MNPLSHTHKIFRHYKGNYYRVLNIAQHTETNEKMVIYETIHEVKQSSRAKDGVWARPYVMFFEKIMYNNDLVNRFEPINPNNLQSYSDTNKYFR